MGLGIKAKQLRSRLPYLGPNNWTFKHYIVVVSIQSQLNNKEKEKNLQMLAVEGEEQEEQGT